MASVGNLRQFSLGDVLRLIGDGHRRGRLVVERGGLRADIYCENGCIMHVWRSGTVPPLAQHWLNSRLITPDQLNALGALVNLPPSQLADAQLAQLAVEHGIVTSEQVFEWAMHDAVDLLSVLLSWRDGDYRFEEGMTPSPANLRLPLPIAAALTAALKRVGPWQAPPMMAITVAQDAVLDFADLDANDPQPVQISHDQWRVLTLVDGLSPLSYIMQQMAMQAGFSPELDLQRYNMEFRRAEETVMRVASELLSDGIAVLRGQEPYSGRWQPQAY